MSSSSSVPPPPSLDNLVPLYINDSTIPKQDKEWDPNNLKLTLSYVKYIARGATADLYELRKKDKTGELIAMKVVYKGHDPRGRPFNEAGMRVAALMAKQEARLMMPLHHNHIIRCFGVYEDPNAYIFLCQFAKGGEMFSLLENGPFTEEVTAHYIEQITDAVKYLHGKGVIHRDLKPENILIKNSHPAPSTGDSILLCDFGNSVRDSEKELGVLRGTAYFSAPEIYFPGFDKPVDIWSIGMLTFLCLTGYHLHYILVPEECWKDTQYIKDYYIGAESADITSKVQAGIGQIASEVGVDFICGCLSKDPTARITASYAYQQVQLWSADIIARTSQRNTHTHSSTRQSNRKRRSTAHEHGHGGRHAKRGSSSSAAR